MLLLHILMNVASGDFRPNSGFLMYTLYMLSFMLNGAPVILLL